DDADGAALAKTVSAQDGSYAFTGLGYGTYFVQGCAPSGYVRTAPAPGYYTTTVSSVGASFTGLDFDNYHTNGSDKNAVTNVSYAVASTATTSTTKKNDSKGQQVHEGDAVNVKFTVVKGHTVTLSFVSYLAQGPGNDMKRQGMMYDYQTGTFTQGSYTMS